MITRSTLKAERIAWAGLASIPADWDIVPLGHICKTQYGLSLSASDDGTTSIVGMQHLVNGRVVLHGAKRVIVDAKTLETYSLHKHDVLFNRTNSYDQVGKTAIFEGHEEPVVFASYLVRLLLKRGCSPLFLNQYMNAPSVIQRIKSLATPGVSQFNVSPSVLSKHLLVPLPTPSEQHAITTALGVWDQRITASERLLKLKRRLKRGMMQQLLTGRRRFAGFTNTDLTRVRLADVFVKVAEPVMPIADAQYRQIGVRSHGKGIFHKPPVTGSSLGTKRVFRVIPGCLTLNIIFAWERALAITTDRENGMIASHRFPMFRPDPTKLIPEYALAYLLSDHGMQAVKVASPGGAGRNRTLNQGAFLKAFISLPPVAEQQKIVAVLSLADREIDLLEQQLAALKEQKQGLMQKLLTGQVRIKNSVEESVNRRGKRHK